MWWLLTPFDKKKKERNSGGKKGEKTTYIWACFFLRGTKSHTYEFFKNTIGASNTNPQTNKICGLLTLFLWFIVYSGLVLLDWCTNLQKSEIKFEIFYNFWIGAPIQNVFVQYCFCYFEKTSLFGLAWGAPIQKVLCKTEHTWYPSAVNLPILYFIIYVYLYLLFIFH